MSSQTAREAGRIGCRSCLFVNQNTNSNCDRCGKRLYSRVPDSLQRTYALALVAMMLYIPANVLPITNTVYLGASAPSTIFGGVVTLWEMGSYGIAMVIFVASIFVPVAKLVILLYLCEVVRRKQVTNPEKSAVLYRVTEFIGRWSMIDVFVVAVLVALVKLGNIISFYPGPAALSFAGVVMITMVAAAQFDPRLLWDINGVQSNE